MQPFLATVRDGNWYQECFAHKLIKHALKINILFYFIGAKAKFYIGPQCCFMFGGKTISFHYSISLFILAFYYIID